MSDKWLQINDVICVYVDMKNSTQFSASSHASTTGKIYTLFTGTAVRILKQFDASYIDIRGDGVFGLFNSDEIHKALASAVTFKTFASEVFIPKVLSKKKDFETGVHIGIDQGNLLVSKIGLNKYKNNTDMFNEVWAGKPVNFASKLAGLSENNEIFVSERYYKNITNNNALYSCACSEPVLLWQETNLEDNDKIPFDKAMILNSSWCTKHGSETLEDIIATDEQ
jgi:class 3 adenylate cyclase